MTTTSILLDRSYDLGADQLLYHYCTSATMQAICDHKTIRFSDINMMNDFSEVRYAYEVFEQAATELLNSDIPNIGRIPRDFFDKIDSIIAPHQFRVHPVIACFSLENDILSQWARYGANGAGFCLGFSGKALKSLPVTIGAVNYVRQDQIQEMKVALGSIYLQDQDYGGDFGKEAQLSAQLLTAEMAFIKHPTFAEEREVRLLHLLDVHIEAERWWLSDEGGVSDGIEVKGQNVKFRLSDEKVIAYIDVPFSDFYESDFLRDIKAGPKNQNGPGNILYLTGGAGLKNVRVSHSTCPYR